MPFLTTNQQYQTTEGNIHLEQNKPTGSTSKYITVIIDYIRWQNKKLSCRRETVWCFVSLNISLSHSRSLKVIRNDTPRACVNPISVSIQRLIMLWPWNLGKGHSRSLTMALFNKSHTTYYWPANGSIALSYHFRVIRR